MVKRFTLIVIVLIAASLLAFASYGLDNEGNPNDPTVNENANACFDEGSLESKCESDWEWVCGWYLIRFEYDLISRSDFPNDCRVMLPAEFQQIVFGNSSEGRQNSGGNNGAGDNGGGGTEEPLPTEEPVMTEEPAPTCTVTNSFGTSTYEIPNGGFQSGMYTRYYSNDGSNLVLCFNGGWWCGGSTWMQGYVNSGAAPIESTTCDLP